MGKPPTAAAIVYGLAATAGLYVGFLGWHAKKEPSPGGGECTGPYEAWQGVGLGIGLVVVAGFAAWHAVHRPVLISCVLCLTVLWSVDALTINDPCSDGASLWPIGAFLLATSSAIGLGLVAETVRMLRHAFVSI